MGLQQGGPVPVQGLSLQSQPIHSTLSLVHSNSLIFIGWCFCCESGRLSIINWHESVLGNGCGDVDCCSLWTIFKLQIASVTTVPRAATFSFASSAEYLVTFRNVSQTFSTCTAGLIARSDSCVLRKFLSYPVTFSSRLPTLQRLICKLSSQHQLQV